MAPPTTVTHHHPKNNRAMLKKKTSRPHQLFGLTKKLENRFKARKERLCPWNIILKEPPFVPKVAHDAWLKHVDDWLDVSYLMLVNMIPDLQRVLEHFNAFDMINISSRCLLIKLGIKDLKLFKSFIPASKTKPGMWTPMFSRWKVLWIN